jgi:ABC-type hemin transport system ATPase subunit
VTSLKWCDRIAVLEAGRITAIGTHSELVATSPLYRDVLRHQQLTAAPDAHEPSIARQTADATADADGTAT